MAQIPDGPVVVGVDGSRAGGPALAWAARFAADRKRPLRVVHIYPYPSLAVSVAPESLPPEQEWRPAFERIVDDAVLRAREAAGGPLEVTGHLAEGTPAEVLIEEGDRAGLVVIGSRGHGGFRGLIVGSVSVQVAAHATCPVVVVPPRSGGLADGPVVVGVDGSELSEAAVGFAFEEASFRSAELHAVSAWSVPAGLDLVPLQVDIDRFSEDQDRALAESVAGYQTTYPDVPVRRSVALGSAAQLLLQAGKDAQLIVVGSRGRGGFKGMLLGSVSQSMLFHATCPVAIIKNR
ncbi:universal stress protein [Actinocatenispora rupis]|uniref:Universal stress protein n=1 Tax=Actinocatenispora rupis TaxID=519421 RepID=A0A8J3NAE3_9ACTN|nr:universal stress protein [Actinocatenispora rupis]GID09620.1 universal stress protein [Actinocatenispora rupis]